MKFTELVTVLPWWAAYGRALYNALLHPRASASKWCHDPRRCTLRHKLVLIQPPNKSGRFGFKHIEV